MALDKIALLHDITQKDLADTQQACEQLQQAIAKDNDTVNWQVVKKIAFMIDDDHQQMHLVLGNQRRADPQLHADVIRSMQSFHSILDTVVGREMPAEIQEKLEHYRSSAKLRAQWINEMCESKNCRDTELGIPLIKLHGYEAD